MAEIIKTDSRRIINYMARDYDTLLDSMRKMIPAWLPEWKTYESETDFGNVLLQLFAHMGDILSYYQDRIANEAFLGTAQERRSIIHHLRLIGYRLSTAAPASAALRLFVPSGTSGKITIQTGDAFAAKSTKQTPGVRFEYARPYPLVIDCDAMIETGNGLKYYDGVPVEEGRLISEERLGVSDGTPNQRFPLGHAPLIIRSLESTGEINKDISVVSILNGTVDTWQYRDSLALSTPLKKHFTIEVDENDQATVIFGDGKFGAVPTNGCVIRATYRVGGGIFGNVPAGRIETVIASHLSSMSVSVTNESPATGGSDRESIAHAVFNAPGVFRSQKRAVTAEDYKSLALNFAGVGKAYARATSWNIVALYVAPQGGGQVSDVLRENLIAYFQDKKPISTTLEVHDVDYVPIYITVKLGVSSFYPVPDVVEKVRDAAGRLLHFDNVDFAMKIYLSKFYEAFEAIDGVSYATIQEFRTDETSSGKIEKDGTIILDPNEIPIMPNTPAYNNNIIVVLEE